jgi:hypothetical protein
VDFSLFKARGFTGANITMFLFGIAVQGAILMVVLYYMNALTYSQLHAAYALLPMPLAAFVVSVLAGRLSGRLNPHVLGLAGLVLLAAGFGLLCLLSTDASYLDVAWRSLLLGAGIGLVFQSQPSISLSQVPRSKLGVGSGIFNTFRQIGFVLGVAILISVFTGQLQTNLGQARIHAMALVQADTKISLPLRRSIVSYYRWPGGTFTARVFSPHSCRSTRLIPRPCELSSGCAMHTQQPPGGWTANGYRRPSKRGSRSC